jgi:hypothetical protein
VVIPGLRIHFTTNETLAHSVGLAYTLHYVIEATNFVLEKKTNDLKETGQLT